MSGSRSIIDTFAARDPAHARLTVAVGVTTGVLASALLGQWVVQAFHAQAGLLAVSIFLSLQAGSMVKDPSPGARLVTTALLIPALVLAIASATALAAHRPLVISGFVLLTGAAIWVRKYGPRAAAIGSLSFMGYFFALFMRPTLAELPSFCLVGAMAVMAQVCVRAVLLLRRPRRELAVLLSELRAGSAAAVRAAHRSSQESRPTDALRRSLARLDDVGRAITGWQQRFQTKKYVRSDHQSFAEMVLDARVDTEEACNELASRGESVESASVSRVEHALFAVLDSRATPSHVHAGREVAAALLEDDQKRIADVAAYLLAQSAVSHARLREIGQPHPPESSRDHRSTILRETPKPVPAPRAAKSDTVLPAQVDREPTAWRWKPWRSWAPTTRMAVQAMLAAVIAAGVGEAISASRWYWAVMTAFVIFIGTTTRSGVLTRAYRRVAGTAIGVCAGVAAVALVGSHTALLIAICIVAVFGMLYLGPLNYLYSSAFITAMLVALYRMLGVLDGSILELRLIETASGAAIGVLSAYAILSASSRPVLVAKVDAYFAALTELLDAAARVPLTDGPELLRLLESVEAAQADLDQTVSSMSAALFVGSSDGARRDGNAVHMMYVASRAAARFVQGLRAPTPSTRNAQTNRAGALVAPINIVAGQAEIARRALVESPPGLSSGDSNEADTDPTSTHVIDDLGNLPSGDLGARAALMALARIHWALLRVTDAAGHRKSRSWGADKRAVRTTTIV